MSLKIKKKEKNGNWNNTKRYQPWRHKVKKENCKSAKI